jgi:hypothetical protein
MLATIVTSPLDPLSLKGEGLIRALPRPLAGEGVRRVRGQLNIRSLYC